MFILKTCFLLAAFCLRDASAEEKKATEEKSDGPEIGDRLMENIADAFLKSLFPDVDKIDNPPTQSPIEASRGVFGQQAGRGQHPLPPQSLNGFFPSGLQGRTDLPASYVYPFASPGSIVRPSPAAAQNSGQPYYLRPQGFEHILGIPPQPQFRTEGLQAPSPSQSQLNPFQLPHVPQDLQRGPQNFLPNTGRLSTDHVNFGRPGAAFGDPSQNFGQAGIDPSGEILKQYFENQYGINAPPVQQVQNNPFGGFASQNQPYSDYEQQPSFIIEPPGEVSPQFNNYHDRKESQTAATDSHLIKDVDLAPKTQLSDISVIGKVINETARSNRRRKPAVARKQLVSPTVRTTTNRPAVSRTTTATSLLVRPAPTPPLFSTPQTTPKQLDLPVCAECLPVDVSRITGAWTQIYGNRKNLQKIYSNVMGLKHLNMMTADTITTEFRQMQPTCVGLQVADPNVHQMALNVFFRDDSLSKQLHEMIGVLEQDRMKNALVMRLPNLTMPTCVVKMGPGGRKKYDYLVLVETAGENRCRSHHVFARNTRRFFRRYNRPIADYLQKEVDRGTAMPLSPLPFPRLCQLRT